MHNMMFRKTGHATPGDPRFEKISQVLIVASLLVMSIATMTSIPNGVRNVLITIDALIGAGFAIEYALRIYFAADRRKYIFSFWGIIDFIAVIPALFIGGTQWKALRIIRLLRLFRLMKLYRSSAALHRLGEAFKEQKYEFIVFGMLSVLMFYVAAVGIYTFEHEAQPEAFPSIPASFWWALTTLTTVGYGDIYPITTGGRLFTGVILLIGLGLVAVPTGLIAAALQNDSPTEQATSNQDAETEQGKTI